ncbi:GTP cyclohydrolase 1 type 2/Nif3 [Mycena rebaudengoi]|nr:GTP cyclohydrolase 1 type 2/Nif3 [Mycena rebaudengoi]
MVATNVFTKSVCNGSTIAPLRPAGLWDSVRSALFGARQSRLKVKNHLCSPHRPRCAACGASLIVPYHPPILSPLKALALASPLQSTLVRGAAAGISVYSPHTALDGVYGGVNDWPAGYTGAGPGDGILVELKDAEEPALGGDGRVVRFWVPRPMDVLVEDGAGVAACPRFRVGYASTKPARVVLRVALCAGSGGSMLTGTPTDLYLTRDEPCAFRVLALLFSLPFFLFAYMSPYFSLRTHKYRTQLPPRAYGEALHELKLPPHLAPSRRRSQGLYTVEGLVSERDTHPLAIV